MGRVIVFNNVTLDGVMQAPGRPDEDTRDDFRYGGWAAPYADPSIGLTMGEAMGGSAAMLFGRRTYEDFYSVWPERTDNPFSAILTNAQKYVASTTLAEPLPWVNSTLLAGDATDAVASLMERSPQSLVILGSGALIQSLMRRHLIDEYVLLISPLVLGSGRKLFPDGAPYTPLRLISARGVSTGLVVATYQPASA